MYPIGQRFKAKAAQVRIQLVSPAGGRSLPRMLEVLVPVDGGFLEIPILGRTPFLDRYELTVRNWKREFVLRETAPTERMAGRKATQ